LARIALATLLAICTVLWGAPAAEGHAAGGIARWQLFGSSKAPRLYHPYGLATDAQGDVFVADAGNFRIVRLSTAGKLLNSWGKRGSGQGEFGQSGVQPGGGPLGPLSIAADGQGDVFVADAGNRRIEKFSSQGKLLAQWSLHRVNPALLAVAVDAAGYVYVAASWPDCPDYSCDTSTTVEQKRSPSGRVLATWHLPPGLPPDGLAVAVDPGGTSYVLSAGGETVEEAGSVFETQFEKLSPTGAVLGYVDTHISVGTATQKSGRDRLSVPLMDVAGAVATDWQGNVYVMTTFSESTTDPTDRFRVEERSPSGTLLRTFGVSIGRGSVDPHLAVDPHGYVYAADSFSGSITRVSPAGSGGTAWPGEPRAKWQLSDPEDVALDHEGNVYVADTGNNRVVKLSPAGKPLAHWGHAGTGPWQLWWPIGIAVEGAGNVYVTGGGDGRIRVFSPAGQAVGGWSLGPQNDYEVAVGTNGNVYVLCGCHGITVYSPAGQQLADWGPYLGGADSLGLPGGIAVDAVGNVYVTDRYNHRIVKFSPQGTVLAKWTVPGSQAGTTQGADPRGLAVDGQGNVYVADASTDSLLKLAPDGTVIDRWGTTGSRTGQFHTPGGVALDSQGNVYVADTGNNRIQKLTVGG
jgi:DNA-binding beta-propeller fold protein YncE